MWNEVVEEAWRRVAEKRPQAKERISEIQEESPAILETVAYRAFFRRRPPPPVRLGGYGLLAYSHIWKKLGLFEEHRNLATEALHRRCIQTVAEAIGVTRDGLTSKSLGDRYFPGMGRLRRKGRYDILPPDHPKFPGNSNEPRCELTVGGLAAVFLANELHLDISVRDALRIPWAIGLERAMVAGAPLPLREVLQSPVAHTLLWEIGNTVVRIAEDGSLADINECRVPVPSAGTARVAHPFRWPTGHPERWGQIFADYEILQPFEQISRSIFRSTATAWHLENPLMTRSGGCIQIPGIPKLYVDRKKVRTDVPLTPFAISEVERSLRLFDSVDEEWRVDTVADFYVGCLG